MFESLLKRWTPHPVVSPPPEQLHRVMTCSPRSAGKSLFHVLSVSIIEANFDLSMTIIIIHGALLAELIGVKRRRGRNSLGDGVGRNTRSVLDAFIKLNFSVPFVHLKAS